MVQNDFVLIWKTMLDLLSKKIEKRLAGIRGLNYISKLKHLYDYSDNQFWSLLSSEAFVLDFYKQQLQDLAGDATVDQTTLRYLQEEVNNYRINLNVNSTLSPERYLLRAFEANDFELFDIALIVGVDLAEINRVWTNQDTLLTRAAFEGKIDFVKRLIAIKRIHINASNKWGETALILLCERPEEETLETVNALLQLGADINGESEAKAQGSQHQSGRTALIAAASSQNLKIIEALLRLPNVDFNFAAKDKSSYTALEYGIATQRYDIVTLLLNAGSPVSASSFELACEKGDITILKSLVQSPNFEQEINAKSALIRTARAGKTDVIDYLWTLGVDIDFLEECDTPKTPLSIALEYGHATLAERLINLGANRKLAQKILGWTNLMMAAVLGDIVELLIAYQGGEIIDLTKPGWQSNPLALLHAHDHQTNDIIYLLRIMPNIQLPQSQSNSEDEKWVEDNAPKTPEGKKAYAIIALKDILNDYKKKRGADSRQYYRSLFNSSFGGFSKQEELLTVNKLLSTFSGEESETPNAKDFKILSQGELGKRLKIWESYHKTHLIDVERWFKGAILRPKFFTRIDISAVEDSEDNDVYGMESALL